MVHSIEGPTLIRRVGMAPSLRRQGFAFAHCLLAEEGFVVVGMRRVDGEEEVSRLQVFAYVFFMPAYCSTHSHIKHAYILST